MNNDSFNDVCVLLKHVLDVCVCTCSNPSPECKVNFESTVDAQRCVAEMHLMDRQCMWH